MRTARNKRPSTKASDRTTILRCECNQCHVHFRVTAGSVVTGGNCPNCGSYNYEPLCVEPRGRFNPPTWQAG